MKKLSRAAMILAVLGLACSSWAGQVKLEIRNGLVTLSAKDASPREILAEWARVGQTRIVNAERVPGGLITLELNGVPESKALDTVLRAVAGYVAAPRVVPASTGSQYDRIMIMAVARPAAGGASPASTAAAPTPAPYDPRGRTYSPQPSLMVDDQDEPVVQQQQPQPQAVAPGAIGAPQPGMMPVQQQGTPSPYMSQPGMMPAQQQGTPSPYMSQPGVPSGAPSSAPQPGMLTPVPAQQPVSPGSLPGNVAVPKPGMQTPPPKPPGSPGGPGGNL
jgi:hypothetical protein